ncbi:MAG: translation initiation factor IF-2 subunit alpha [Candidatus Ranarchaeia archaeon]|jgi:translation initiation factor 2 subunit 1
MAVTRRKWPEVDELVISTVKKIVSHGAYVALDEYDMREGLIHVSEISSSWVRNIRNHVKENQKTVTKVLRVNQSKNQIDLSLRRVNQQQRRNKITLWKRAQTGEKLLEMASKKAGTTLKVGFKEVGWKLIDTYGGILSGLERIHVDGDAALTNAGITEKWIKILSKIGKTHTTLPQVKISGIFDLRCPQPNGIEVIKNALQSGISQIKDLKEIKGDIWSDGAPKYRVELTAPNYKEAEEALKLIIDEVLKNIEENSGEGEFTRSDVK